MVTDALFIDLGTDIAEAKKAIANADTALISSGVVLSQLKSEVAKKDLEIIILKKKIADMTDDPIPANIPAILDDKFDAPFETFTEGGQTHLKTYFFDKYLGAAKITQGNDEVRMEWKATSNLDDMRAEMGIREHPGESDDTARRDPVGSERFYAFGIYLPTDEFIFDSLWGNQKCVTGQMHQGNSGGIVSPPFSFEMIKTTLSGEVMRGVLAVLGQPTKTIIIGTPPRTPTNIVVHVKWSAGSDGFLKVYRDGVLTPFNHTGPTCNPVSEGLNHKIGNYNPGRKSGKFSVGYKRVVCYTHWQIGTEANSLADFIGGV